jgi:hypothetical protein
MRYFADRANDVSPRRAVEDIVLEWVDASLVEDGDLEVLCS